MVKKKLVLYRWIRSAGFIFIFILLFLYLNRVLMVKRFDGTTPALNFRKQKENTIDVLFLGPSRIGMDIAADVLWEEYGIASYVLWGSEQPFWNTYYMLKDALKTQTPEAIVLEVSAASFTYEYQNDERQIVNTAGMRFGFNKWNAVKASSTKERWLPLFLGLPMYHGRYADISMEDFSYFSWNGDGINDKGAGRGYGIIGGEITDISSITETADIYGKEEKYLKKILEECSRNEIPAILISTPVPDASGEKAYCNTVQMIADEYGCPYYNFNLMYDQTGIEIADFNDTVHLNVYGARKFSRYFGNMLKEQYDLKDRRGDADYASWNVSAARNKNEYISHAPLADKYFMELKDADRTVLAVKYGTWEWDEQSLDILEQLEFLGFDAQSIRMDDGTGHFFTVPNEETDWNTLWNLDVDGTSFTMETDGNVGIFINGENKYSFESAGLAVLVYDVHTHTCIDISTFLQSDGWNIVHYIL